MRPKSFLGETSMIKIIARNHLERFLTNEDGFLLLNIIRPHLQQGEKVIISFDGVDSLPSSFVNTALLPLLHDLPFSKIKEYLSFEDTNSQINSMIKDRFKSAIEKQLAIPVY